MKQREQDVLEVLREQVFCTPSMLCRLLNLYGRKSEWCPVGPKIQKGKCASVPAVSHARMLRVLRSLRSQGLVIHAFQGTRMRMWVAVEVAERLNLRPGIRHLEGKS